MRGNCPFGFGTTPGSWRKFFGAALQLIVLLGLFDEVSASRKPPSIIFILADDLGYGDIQPSDEVNRTNEIPTPNIQALADSGIKFRRGYSGQVCAPSRCTLLTGRHTGHCTVRGNDGAYSPLLPSDWTVARLLKEKANYTTALFGKWGLGNFNTTGYPLAQGFDRFIGQDSQVACHNWYPSVIQSDANGTFDLPGNDFGKDGSHCIKEGNTQCTWMNDLIVAESVQWMRAHQSQPDPAPFFIYLASTTPHVGDLAGVSNPYPTPFEYYGHFVNASWSEELKYFAAATWAQDHIVGAVVSELKALGIENNTIVFFSGDNGPDDHDFTVFDDPGPFRGKKRSLHEGGIRQTILASWPGTISPGRATQDLFAFWDFFATAADVAGVSPSELPEHDGISILPTLLDHDKQHSHPYLYWEFCDYAKVDGLLPQQYAGGWIQALRFDEPPRQWKVIRSNRDNSTILLFDLATDVSESSNMAASYADVVTKACGYMDEAHVEIPTWKSSYNASDKCCTGCFNPQGCEYPCQQFPSHQSQAKHFV